MLIAAIVYGMRRDFQMYCKYLRKGITARKTPKYCRGYKNRSDYGQLSEVSTGDKNRPM